MPYIWLIDSVYPPPPASPLRPESVPCSSNLPCTTSLLVIGLVEIGFQVFDLDRALPDVDVEMTNRECHVFGNGATAGVTVALEQLLNGAHEIGLAVERRARPS